MPTLRMTKTKVASVALLTLIASMGAGCALQPDEYSAAAKDHWGDYHWHEEGGGRHVSATVDHHGQSEVCPHDLQAKIVEATDIGSQVHPMRVDAMERLSVEMPAVMPGPVTPPVVMAHKAVETDRGDIGQIAIRRGDEIMIAGQMVHTGAPVVLWMDEGGYDAYRVERRFAPADKSGWDDSKESGLATPNRFGLRRNIDEDTREAVRGGGWTLGQVRDAVDQIVIHYDASGTSQRAFKALHDGRGLSSHFLIDIDGTIYQTLDVKERAWHATVANDRSVGIELANIGAYPKGKTKPLARWYHTDDDGTRITIPKRLGDGGVRTEGFIGRPARADRISGEINGRKVSMHDFTAEQYSSLTRLVAALGTALPKIEMQWPGEEDGSAMDRTMSRGELDAYRGVLGHYHIQKNKVDPGPAFQGERVIERARMLMGKPIVYAPRPAVAPEVRAADGTLPVVEMELRPFRELPLDTSWVEVQRVHIAAGQNLVGLEQVEVREPVAGEYSMLPGGEFAEHKPEPIICGGVVTTPAPEPASRTRRPRRECECPSQDADFYANRERRRSE